MPFLVRCAYCGEEVKREPGKEFVHLTFSESGFLYAAYTSKGKWTQTELCKPCALQLANELGIRAEVEELCSNQPSNGPS